MTNQVTRQAMAQDIKREIMMDLQKRNMVYSGGQGMAAMRTTNAQPVDPAIIQLIKRDVIAQIEAEQEAREEMIQQNYISKTYPSHQGSQAYPSAQQSSYHQTQTYPYDPVLLETIKRDVLAQMEAGRNYYTDPYLIEAVKRDVLHELQINQNNIRQ